MLTTTASVDRQITRSALSCIGAKGDTPDCNTDCLHAFLGSGCILVWNDKRVSSRVRAQPLCPRSPKRRHRGANSEPSTKSGSEYRCQNWNEDIHGRSPQARHDQVAITTIANSQAFNAPMANDLTTRVRLDLDHRAKKLSLPATLSFFKEVVTRGEGWNAECDAAYEDAQEHLKELEAMLRKMSQENLALQARVAHKDRARRRRSHFLLHWLMACLALSVTALGIVLVLDGSGIVMIVFAILVVAAMAAALR